MVKYKWHLSFEHDGKTYEVGLTEDGNFIINKNIIDFLMDIYKENKKLQRKKSR